MRILKYIFLLLLLIMFATTVFVATQNSNFSVKRSAIINSPRTTVFNYVNDYRNWETFGSWKKEDPRMTFFYPKNTFGKGASYSWKGSDGEGNSKTIAVSDNQSIHQKLNYNSTTADVYWTFKDTVGGTKVAWESKGTMGFGFKVYSTLQGGVEKLIGNMYERSLSNLDRTLDYELHTYHIVVKGQVQKLGCIYLKQTITSKISNVPKNLRIMIPNLISFFRKNNLEMYGKPFILYHTYDVANGITTLSVCIPMKEEIFVREGSDVAVGQLHPFQAVKTTLTGDYSHSKEAWDKTLNYMRDNHLSRNTSQDYLEIYSKSISQVPNSSQWVTALYIPIGAKAAVVAKPKTIIPAKVTPTEAIKTPTTETAEP